MAYTLRDLIRETDSCEATFVANSHIADRIEEKEGSIATARWRVQAAATKFRPEPTRMLGIDRIVLICDQLDGDNGISSANVRRLRAKVCRIKSIPLVKAGDLALDEVASILESNETIGPDNGVEHGYFELPREIEKVKDFVSTVIEKELPRLDALAQEGDATKFVDLVPLFVDTIWFNLERIYNELKSDTAVSAPPNKPVVQSPHGAKLAMNSALTWLNRIDTRNALTEPENGSSNLKTPLSGEPERSDAALVVEVIGAESTEMPNVPTDDELSEREWEILQALDRKKATSKRRSISRATAAHEADNRSKPSSYFKAIAKLKKRGLIDSCLGPGAGIWLTETGIRKLREKK